jgi:hypothetical protein
MAKVFLPGTFSITVLLTGQTNENMGSNYSASIAASSNQDNLFQALSKFPSVVWLYIGFEVLYLAGVYLFSFRSLFKNGRSVPWVWFLVLIILYSIAVVGPAGTSRFRVAIMPLLCVLAACSLTPVIYVVLSKIRPAQRPTSVSG